MPAVLFDDDILLGDHESVVILTVSFGAFDGKLVAWLWRRLFRTIRPIDVQVSIVLNERFVGNELGPRLLHTDSEKPEEQQEASHDVSDVNVKPLLRGLSNVFQETDSISPEDALRRARHDWPLQLIL